MYPTLPVGPLSLPTAPILALIALLVTIEIAMHYGPRLQLSPNDVWNTCFVALASGVIVARLWTVLQLWSLYMDLPRLIFSFKPSGFALLPGILAALAAAFVYMLWKALDPLKVAAAVAVGALVGLSIFSLSAFLTGQTVGLPSTWPTAIDYFGTLRHPVGLYRATLLLALAAWIWLRPTAGSTNKMSDNLNDIDNNNNISDIGVEVRTEVSAEASATRTLLLCTFFVALIWLASAGWVDPLLSDAPHVGWLRITQVGALLLALTSALLLAHVPNDALPLSSAAAKRETL